MCRMFKFEHDYSNSKDFLIKTSLGSSQKRLDKMNLFVKYSESEIEVPFLVDNDLDLDFHLPGLRDCFDSLTRNGHKLSINIPDILNDTVKVHGELMH